MGYVHSYYGRTFDKIFVEKSCSITLVCSLSCCISAVVRFDTQFISIVLCNGKM